MVTVETVVPRMELVAVDGVVAEAAAPLVAAMVVRG